MHAVVQLQEHFSISCRSADIRFQNSHTKLIDEVIRLPQKYRGSLGLGSAVDDDDDRALAGKFRRVRSIQPAAYFAAVEALPCHQLWNRERSRIESAGLALRPAVYLSSPEIHRVHVRR